MKLPLRMRVSGHRRRWQYSMGASIDKKVMSVWVRIPLSWQHEYFGINTHLETRFSHALPRCQAAYAVHVSHGVWAIRAKVLFVCATCAQKKRGRNYITYVCCLYPIKVMINYGTIEIVHAALKHSLNTRVVVWKWLKMLHSFVRFVFLYSLSALWAYDN